MNLAKAPFNLDVTLCCGQVFRWTKLGNWWYGVAGDQAFKIRQAGENLEYHNVRASFVKNYFSLDINLQEIGDAINKDTHIAKAIEAYWGLRLIRQEPWECLISYICATYKSIPAIKHMLNNMAKKFGEKKFLDDIELYTFPKCETLSHASEEQLKECGLGYRAEYVLLASRKIRETGCELEALKDLPYADAKKALMEFPGVGEKVADCVLLFSLGKTESFPVDVWIKRVILNHYKDKLGDELGKRLLAKRSLGRGDYEKLNAFGRAYFGRYAGYAQEYLYHYERMAI